MDHDQQVNKTPEEVGQALAKYRLQYLSSDLQVVEHTQYLTYDLEEKFAETRAHFHPGFWVLLGGFAVILGVFVYFGDRYIQLQSRKMDVSITDYKGVDLDEVIKSIDNSNKFKQKLDQAQGELGSLRDRLRSLEQSQDAQTGKSREEMARLASEIEAKEKEAQGLADAMARSKAKLEASLARVQEDLEKVEAAGKKKLDEANRAAEERLAAATREYQAKMDAASGELTNLKARLAGLQDSADSQGAAAREEAKRLAAQIEAKEKEQADLTANLGRTKEKLEGDLGRAQAELENENRRHRKDLDEANRLAEARLAAAQQVAHDKEARLREDYEARLAQVGQQVQYVSVDLARTRADMERAELQRRTEASNHGAELAKWRQTVQKQGDRLKQMEAAGVLVGSYRRFVDQQLRRRNDAGVVVDILPDKTLVVGVNSLMDLPDGTVATLLRGEEEIIGNVTLTRTPEGTRGVVSGLQPGKTPKPLDRVMLEVKAP